LSTVTEHQTQSGMPNGIEAHAQST